MSSTSFVISREAILQRRACSPRRRRPSILTPPPLHIISEEEEYLRSRSPSPMSGYASTSSTRTTPSLKNRRRHCNLSPSDIQIARDFTPSPEPSPDSFRLTFTDKSYTFPHPPIPTPSSNNLNVFCGSPNFTSSGESSPSGSAMPLTPSSPTSTPVSKSKASVPEVYESWEDKIEMDDKPVSFSLSPYTTSFIDSSSSSDSESDNESDSEWYTRELSQVVTVSAPSSSHTQNSRPESMFLGSSKRESTVLPQKRASKRYIPKLPATSTTCSLASIQAPLSQAWTSPQLLSPFPSSPASSHRPPPRNSVPADFEFDDEASSVFSFAMYQVEIDERDAARASSFYGSEAVYGDNEEDYGSPLDPTLPTDSKNSAAFPVPTSPLPPVLEDSEEDEQIIEIPAEQPFERPTSLVSRSSRWSFGTASPARSFNHGHELGKPAANTFDEERVLKSKWSSSTLASVREDHEKRASSRLKLSFLGASPSKKRSSTSGAKIPATPLSPMSFMKKRSSLPISAFTSPTQGVRRMGSSSTMSDAGSIETTSSTASNGLRRKPIPIELFLRA
ncbi:hypothetical protein BKA70DRAFT_1332523 [Coprinopsis sp. MPI-PUGE-AT-0042]|nr:hypothetical protein BKA70DRAFT_1332523 [Coprinopsis sp. MPI-PUGE-AT-0042]